MGKTPNEFGRGPCPCDARCVIIQFCVRTFSFHLPTRWFWLVLWRLPRGDFRRCRNGSNRSTGDSIATTIGSDPSLHFPQIHRFGALHRVIVLRQINSKVAQNRTSGHKTRLWKFEEVEMVAEGALSVQALQCCSANCRVFYGSPTFLCGVV